ncbi:MAG: carbamoyltransferase [Candidatus Marinimicrobia bacterium]|jgi:carbamoyltransferase|nr:carbamoyltransferase [Candidatus Neomarinimicrobiota bacterium]MDP6615157.1 carbamoyltransferase [Candidatus Neomarinimicrobiota bacterium]|tara:strand:+ start:8366 stop:10183 length:1818 start_codon:yes stop_codon:yes gene_type:complete
MYILGISAFYHDSAACLIKNGIIVAAAQEERFTRKKHDHTFPSNAIQYCLREAGIDGTELDYVAFYDKPFLKFERILETYLAYAPFGIGSFLKAMPLWIKKKIWIKEIIKDELNYSGKIIFPEHHESHAASAFFPSPFQEAAFITMDGVGEWPTSSFGFGKDNQIELLADIQFPHSLGLLYSAFTYYTGFRVNSGEYKVMGLAPYGEAKYKDLIYEHLIDVKEDGSFKMNMDYFNYCAGLTMTSAKFHQLFGGPPRKPESELTQKEMDLARSVQEVTEEIVLKMAKHVRKETGMKYLCLAGGVALNCVANGKLLRSGLFDNIWIQPAAGDAGGAIGCALLTWYQFLGNIRNADNKNDFMKGAYLGPNFSNGSIESFLKKNDYSYQTLTDEELPDKIADLIADEKVIGWFQGRMEFGPRALGSRTIIGDARSSEMQKTMNLKIKYRESFRPFAPSVRAENISDYFEIDRESPYMLLVANVQKDRQVAMSKKQNSYFGLEKLNVVRSEIPAITHVDYSARIQSVNGITNPRYHKMLTKFNDKYDCPVIVNTSFNVRGEPIVCTPKDAYLCFMRTEMDYLIMGNYLLDKKDQKTIVGDSDWRSEFELD